MQTASVAFNTGGVISLLIGTVLPVVVGYITKESLNPGLKSGILAGIAGLSGLLTQWLDAITSGTHFAWQAAVLSAFATWLVGEASYYKWWKPSGISDAVQNRGVTDPVPITDNAATPTVAPKWTGPEHLRP